MESEKFCLRWNDFKSNISEAFQDLREENDFFDVTLACEDNQVQAHKVILSACSPFFRDILRRNPHQHPLLYLKDVKYKELLSVINFMYLGEVSVAQDELNSFLNVAEDLRVKGLTQSNNEHSSSNSKANMEQLKHENHFKKSSNQHLNLSSTNPKRTAIFNAPQIKPQVFKKKVDDDVQEVSAIKSEPRDPVQQRAPVRLYQDQAQARYHQHIEQEHELVQEQMFDEGNGQDVEQGTVALDDAYAVDDGYDYNYDDPGYEASVENIAYNDGQVVSEGLDSVILSQMSRNEAGDWQCNECYKTSSKKQNIMEHIEASHMETPGYNCDICFKVFKTKHSLRTHKNVKHKEYKHLQQ